MLAAGNPHLAQGSQEGLFHVEPPLSPFSQINDRDLYGTQDPLMLTEDNPPPSF